MGTGNQQNSTNWYNPINWPIICSNRPPNSQLMIDSSLFNWSVVVLKLNIVYCVGMQSWNTNQNVNRFMCIQPIYEIWGLTFRVKIREERKYLKFMFFCDECTSLKMLDLVFRTVAVHQPFYILRSIFVILFGVVFFSFLFCLCSPCISINFSILFQTLYISVPKERLQAGIGWSGCWHVCNLSVNALGYRRGVVEYELLLWMLKVNINLTMDSKIQVIIGKW